MRKAFGAYSGGQALDWSSSSPSVLSTADLPGYVRNGFAPKDYPDLQRRYLSWVYACASLNACNVSGVPMRLYQRVRSTTTKGLPRRDRRRLKAAAYLDAGDDAVEIDTHPVLDLLNEPMAGWCWTAFEEARQLSQELTGNAYALATALDGQPQELVLLDPAYMTAELVSPALPGIAGWYYGTGTTRAEFQTQQVGHFKFPSPSPIMPYGQGPCAAAFGHIDLDLYMDVHALFTYVNRAQPTFMLVPTGPVGEDQVKRLRAEWNRNYRGAMKAGRTAISPFGWEPKTLGMTSQELQLPEQHKWNREAICAAFGVPLSMITMESSNRAVAEAGMYQYQRMTLAPRVRRRDDVYNQWLLPLFDQSGSLFFASDECVDENEELEIKERQVYVPLGILTVNEARAEDGREPVEWGDEPPRSVAPAPDPGATGPAPPVDAGKGRRIVHDGRGAGRGDHDRSGVADCCHGTADSGGCQCGKRSADKGGPPADNTNHLIETVLRQVWHSQLVEVLAKMPAKAIKDDPVPIFRPEGGWQVWSFGTRHWDRILADKARPIIRGVFVRAAEATATDLAENQGIAAAVAFDVTNEAAVAAVSKTVDRFARSVNATSTDKLVALFESAVEDGKTVTQVRDEVQALFESWGRGDESTASRAEMVARTETARAVTAGTEEVYQQSGIETKVWLSAGDSCEFCIAMDGKQVGVGTPFVAKGGTIDGASGGTMAVDYDDMDGPPAHPNCRCTLQAVLT